MKNTYPITLIPDEFGYLVFIPDFNINTQGKDITEAIEMARDAIGIMGIDFEDDGKPIPAPSDIHQISVSGSEIVTLVDVGFRGIQKKE